MRGTESSDRALSLLELFSETSPEWTTDELVSETGFSRPTLYRYLRTLRRAGLLTSATAASYVLGPRIVELDYLARQSDPLIAAGEPILADLAGRWPSTALIARWYGNRLLCIASHRTAEEPVSSFPRGRPMPLHRGAVGRAVLAYLPAREMRPLVDEYLPALSSQGFGETPEDIIGYLKGLRRADAVVARGEVTQGMIGIAAPVFDFARSPCASLGLSIPETIIRPEDFAEIARAVRSAAERAAS